MPFLAAIHHENIDWTAVAASTIAGGISGAVLPVIIPAATSPYGVLAYGALEVSLPSSSASPISPQARTLLETLSQPGDYAQVPPGAISAELMAELHRATDTEFALVRLADDRRVLVRGLAGKIDALLPPIKRVIAHTHPSGRLTPSMNPDVYNIWIENNLSQHSSLIITANGQAQRFFKSEYQELIQYWLERGN